jgi:hypothetical protein
VLHLTWASDAVAGPQSRCGFTYRLTGDQLLAARRLKSAIGERSRTSDEMFIERCGGTLGYGRDRTDGMVSEGVSGSIPEEGLKFLQIGIFCCLVRRDLGERYGGGHVHPHCRNF